MNDNLITILNNRKLVKATIATLMASGLYHDKSQVIIELTVESNKLQAQANYKKWVRAENKKSLGLKVA